jgi:hypothetical protein
MNSPFITTISIQNLNYGLTDESEFWRRLSSILEVNFSMSQTAYETKEKEEKKNLEKGRMPAIEKTLVLRRLQEAVEKLKEARREITHTVQRVIRMKETGDDIADQAVTAVIEAFANDCDLSIPNTNYVTNKKREAATPLLLLRSE